MVLKVFKTRLLEKIKLLLGKGLLIRGTAGGSKIANHIYEGIHSQKLHKNRPALVLQDPLDFPQGFFNVKMVQYGPAKNSLLNQYWIFLFSLYTGCWIQHCHYCFFGKPRT